MWRYSCPANFRTIIWSTYPKRHITKSSKAWLARQKNDPFVQNRGSLRSRSSFKLLEMINSYPDLIGKNDTVFDLGSAPGGWSMIARSKTDANIVAVDLLHMEPIDGVMFIQGDFTSDNIQNQCKSLVNDHSEKIVILSDMLQNVSGNHDRDHFRSMILCDSALNFASSIFKSGGNFVCKFYMGSEDSDFLKRLGKLFNHVKVYKPKSSRKESREAYFVCRQWRTSPELL